MLNAPLVRLKKSVLPFGRIPCRDSRRPAAERLLLRIWLKRKRSECQRNGGEGLKPDFHRREFVPAPAASVEMENLRCSL